jgi:hypothetical protein
MVFAEAAEAWTKTSQVVGGKGGGAAKNREGVLNPLGPGFNRWAPCVRDHDLDQGQLPRSEIKVPWI